MTLGYAVKMIAFTLAKIGGVAKWAAWSHWVCYLLEILEKEVDPLEYAVFLEALQEDVATRLKEGRWQGEREQYATLKR